MAQRDDAVSALTIEWDVTSRADPEAFDQYCDSLREMLEVVDIGPDQRRDFRNTTSATLFANGSIGRATSVQHSLGRSPAMIRSSGLDAINITVNFAPMDCDCDGLRFRSAPGSVQFRDLARPSTSRFEVLDLVTLMTPREAFSPEVRDGLHGQVLSAETAAGRLIASHLCVLAEQAAVLGSDDGAAGVRAALLMIERALGLRREATPAETRMIHDTVRKRASRFMETRLLDPTLTTQQIASAVGASRTTLFRAFAPGGLRRHLIELRLDRARSVLMRRTGRRQTVYEVAYRHGFASASHFGRLYRERFGHSPGDTAPAVAVGAGPQGRQSPMRHDVVMDWLRDRADLLSRSPQLRYA